MRLEVFIPVLPPGINATYKIGNRRMYKSGAAVEWQGDAALMIGARAGEIGWTDDCDQYDIWITQVNSKLDTDAVCKLVIDTVADKLGFNDNRIRDDHNLMREGPEKGIRIVLIGVIDEI